MGSPDADRAAVALCWGGFLDLSLLWLVALEMGLVRMG